MSPEPDQHIIPQGYVELVEADQGIHPFDIESAMDASPRVARMVLRHGYFESSQRPEFGPRQIRTLEGIKHGVQFWLNHVNHHNPDRTHRIGKIQVEGTPYHDEGGTWWVDCQGWKSYGGLVSVVDKVSLTSLSVVPNPKGLWNAWNWLEHFGPIHNVY